MKKIIALILIASLALAITACSIKPDTNDVFNQAKVDTFYKKWHTMEANIRDVLNPFAENPEVTKEFLTNIHQVEDEYTQLMDYVDTLTVAEYKHYDDYYTSIQTEIEAGWVREPITEVKCNDSKFTHGWSYYNGTLKLDEGYYVTTEWTENLNTTSANDDCENERVYTILDSSKDAYLLFSGELGYQLIRIVATES